MTYTLGYNEEYSKTMSFHMPSPWSHEALQFKGRKIWKFLYEFELLAQSTWLLDVQKCEYIELYCKDREVQFIKTLPGYKNKCWSELTESLLSYYPAEDKDKVYHTKDLRRFIDLECKIKRHSDFDKYQCKFWVIAILLEERSWSYLTKVEMDDYFFCGLKPKSFCKDVKDKLRAQKLWMDWTNPPKMDRVCHENWQWAPSSSWAFQSNWSYGSQGAKSPSLECSWDAICSWSALECSGAYIIMTVVIMYLCCTKNKCMNFINFYPTIYMKYH